MLVNVYKVACSHVFQTFFCPLESFDYMRHIPSQTDTSRLSWRAKEESKSPVTQSFGWTSIAAVWERCSDTICFDEMAAIKKQICISFRVAH